MNFATPTTYKIVTGPWALPKGGGGVSDQSH